MTVKRSQLPEIRKAGFITTTCDNCGGEMTRKYRQLRQRFTNEGIDEVRLCCSGKCARDLAVKSTKDKVDLPQELQIPDNVGMEGLKVAAALVQETLLKPRNIGILRKAMQAEFAGDPFKFFVTNQKLLQDQVNTSDVMSDTKIIYQWKEDDDSSTED